MVDYIKKFLEKEKIRNNFIEIRKENEIFNCILFKDKVVFIMEFDCVEEIDDYISQIPELKYEIQEKIVDNQDIKLNNTSIAAFLWDIYLVAICTNDNEIDELTINKIEYDTFVAKKVVIKYESEEDLIKKFEKNILPDRIINELILDEIESSSINNSFEIFNNENYKKFILDYISKNEEEIDIGIIDDYLNKLISEDDDIA